MIEITEEEKHRRKAELLERALSSAYAWDKEACRRQLRLVVNRQTAKSKTEVMPQGD